MTGGLILMAAGLGLMAVVARYALQAKLADWRPGMPPFIAAATSREPNLQPMIPVTGQHQAVRPDRPEPPTESWEHATESEWAYRGLSVETLADLVAEGRATVTTWFESDSGETVIAMPSATAAYYAHPSTEGNQ